MKRRAILLAGVGLAGAGLRAFPQSQKLRRVVFLHPGAERGLRRVDRNIPLYHEGARYTDVQALVELGLLEKDERGGLHAPFDEIVIRAGLRKAA
ncbi:MAG: hypothetical protein ACT4P9_17235 [Betaproteobacteria bacterium]